MSLNQNDKTEQLDDEEDNNSCEEILPFQSEIDSSSSTSLRRATKSRKIKDVVKDEILPLLPAKALIRFRSVSKEWDRCITSPLFAFHQSYSFSKLSGFFCQFDEGNCVFLSLDHRAYGVPIPPLRILPESVTVRSSSGGLLLCQEQNCNNTYYICNPATEDWKELPEPEMYHKYGSATVLAFEPSAQNMHAHYQVICAVCLFETAVGFEVYSSETMSWSKSIAFYLKLEYSSFTGNGFHMKGIAYWMMSTRKVLAYDVKDESYEIICLLSNCPDDGVLTEMHGELCYIGIFNSSGNECLIKIYGGMFLKLKRTIEVHLDSLYSDQILGYRVLPCFREGEVTILAGSLIYSCRLSDGRIELISREGVGSCWGGVSYMPYVNSLVSVTLGGTAQIEANLRIHQRGRGLGPIVIGIKSR